jgi:DNA-binding NarL/FixJ family response regulator
MSDEIDTQPDRPGGASRNAPKRSGQLRCPQALGLTSRQGDVLALMAEGWSNAAIARELFISEKAVVAHTSQIYDRLELFADDDTHRRVNAVLRYLTAPPPVPSYS